jgi:CheY-like chemotaxis protein
MTKRRLLVVDDELSFTRLLKLNLEQSGDYEVRVENGSERVVAAVREFRPALILLDIAMPGLSGPALATRLRADPATRATPIVFLSAAVGKKRVREKQGQIGGYPIIAKPASLDEILEAIEPHLPAVPSAAESPAAAEQSWLDGASPARIGL